MNTLIDTSLIVPGNNDRKTFKSDKLQELANSIKEHGLIQPITVRQLDIDVSPPLYQIVAGERRFRAVELLGWKDIPAHVLDLTDEEASAVMLAENVARENLDPIEEAIAYQQRMSSFCWSVSDVSKRAGVSAVRVRFRLKLLSLRPEIQNLVKSGNLSIGYAQILSDAELSPSFQQVAMRYLNENSKPTPSWFRRVCGELADKQNQAPLFDLPIMGGPLPEALRPKEINEPPTPSTTTPPKFDGDGADRIQFHINFWNQAAMAWHKLGKPFKRQECEAAAKALQFVLSAL